MASLTESFGSHRRAAISPILDCDDGSLEVTGTALRIYTSRYARAGPRDSYDQRFNGDGDVYVLGRSLRRN